MQLTPSAPVCEYIVLQNPALSCYFHTTLQLNNLPVDCARAVVPNLFDLATPIESIT